MYVSTLVCVLCYTVLMTGRVSPPRTGSASLTEAGPTRPTVTKFAGGETREMAPTTQKIWSLHDTNAIFF